MYFLPKYKRGILNRYHKEMPPIERFTKDVSEGVLYLKNLVNNGFSNKTILCYPHFPSRNSTLYKIAKQLGYNVSNKPGRNFQMVMYWEYLTFRKEYELVEKLALDYKVVNLHNRDISKERVDKIHQEVFGYNTKIDPTTFTGKAVRKSDINAIHNYQVIECPIVQKQAGDFYQILINNEVENGTRVEDIRVPVIKGTLDFVYLKHRAISQRFKNPIYCKPMPIEKLLSPEEIKLLNHFIKKFDLDFGEMDVLRNRDDGKIYVIDVNNTPQGPPSGISKEDSAWAIGEMARVFKERLIKA